MFAAHPTGETFDDSVSTKWSVVGWTRPELIEVAFFSGSITITGICVYFTELSEALQGVRLPPSHLKNFWAV